MDLKGSHALAIALSTSAKEAWRHYTTIQTCEPSAAAVLVSRAARKRRQHQRSPSPDQYKMENKAGDLGSKSPDRREVENKAGDLGSKSPDRREVENEAGDFGSKSPDRREVENEAGDFGSKSPDRREVENKAGDFGSKSPDRREVENEAGDFGSKSPDRREVENEAGDFGSESPDRREVENEADGMGSRSPDRREVENEADDRGSRSPDRCPERAVAPMSRVLAESLVSELRVQQLLVGASKQETLHAEAVRGMKILASSTQPTVAPPFTEAADKPPPLNCPDGAGSINSYLAESLGRELRAQQQSVAAQEQEARFVAARDASGSKIGEEEEEEEATLATESKDKSPPLNCPDGAGNINSYLAESLSRELRAQQQSVAAQEQEARFVAAVQRKDASGSKIGEEEEEEEATLATEPLAECPRSSDCEHVHTTSATLEVKPAGVYLAESLVSELRSQQLTVQLRQCEAKHVKAVLNRDRPEHSQLPPDTVTSNSDDHTVHSTPDPTLLATKLPEVVPKLTVTTAKELKDAFSQTSSDLIPTAEAATSTPTRDLHTSATNTELLELQDAGVNTVLSYNKLMKSAQATEKYKKLQAEHKAAVKELRQEKSQRMTSEQLVKIVQTDLSSVQQRNVAETTARLQLESELTGVKAELGYARKQIADKDQRISELEDSLTGTSLLVRKLEEQNAVALMNRGGIDYMVQAKLAEGRAQEAEQKLRVLQVDLLQSQNEVKQLLDRVAGAARERSEMVSSKVHVQLLQIADDRALAAEQRAQELEKEVQDLKRKLSAEKPMTDRNNGFPSLSLSSSFPFTPYSGYSLPSYPTTLSSSWETKPLTSTANGSHSSFGSSSYLGSVGLGSTGSAFSSSLRTPSDASALPKLHDSLITATPSSSYPSDNKQGVPPDTESGSSATGSVLYTPSLLPTALKPHALSTALPKLNETDTTAHLVQTKAATEGSSLGLGVDLPSYDPSRAPDPTPVPSSTPRLKSQADGDSSDWSSSDEDTDTNPFMPSTHANLTAQWEWRSRQDSASADSTATASAAVKPATASAAVKPATTSAAVKPVAHTPTTKRRPPPIAPKPNLRKPLEHEPSHTMGETLRIAQELPCSFEEPARKAGLQLLTTGFRRPRGPSGRNLPSRYLKKQKGLFF